MAKHLRGEIDSKMYQCTGSDIMLVQIKAIRIKVASSRKEKSNACRNFGAHDEAYEQGRREILMSVTRALPRQHRS